MPTNCWKTETDDADEDQQRAEGKQVAGVMLAERGADFREFAFAFFRRHQLRQHLARAAFIALQHKEARRLRHKQQQQQKQRRGNGAGEEHIAPANGVQPRIAAARLRDSIVDEVNHQHAEDDGELVPRHQVSSHFGRRNLRDIHGRQHGCQAHADAAEDAVDDETHHVAGSAVADGRKRKLRRRSAQRRQQEEHGGNHQSALAADVGADPSAHEPADNATDQRARNHKAEQRIRGIGLGRVGKIRKPRIDEIGLQAAHGAVDHGRVISKKQSAQRGNEREQNNIRV